MCSEQCRAEGAIGEGEKLLLSFAFSVTIPLCVTQCD